MARIAASSGEAFGEARHACANSRAPAGVNDLLLPGIPRSIAGVPAALSGPASNFRLFMGVAPRAARAIWSSFMTSACGASSATLVACFGMAHEHRADALEGGESREPRTNARPEQNTPGGFASRTTASLLAC